MTCAADSSVELGTQRLQSSIMMSPHVEANKLSRLPMAALGCGSFIASEFPSPTHARLLSGCKSVREDGMEGERRLSQECFAAIVQMPDRLFVAGYRIESLSLSMACTQLIAATRGQTLPALHI
jgi:hypothetical protein